MEVHSCILSADVGCVVIFVLCTPSLCNFGTDALHDTQSLEREIPDWSEGLC